MAAVPEVIQSIFDARLDLLLPERSPPFIGQYSVSNLMVRALAHLVATDDQQSRLLRCNTNAELLTRNLSGETTLGTIDTKLAGTLAVKVKDPTAAYYASVGAGGALSVYDGAVGTIIGDVWDGVNHALRTIAVV